ncbi:MAG: hypothetical protein KVP17_000467 [Porospora cf. gigantea B]|uniref:uncharacterized protein n=1 Tax=Porospora cf. gigantea B TaxID=2853592 RepID=UPI00357181C0|nr:MAG: hypothetical protein KVP17_000467 [Porospora cf. gigantea B]
MPVSFRKAIRSPTHLREWVHDHRTSVQAWVALFGLVVLVYFFLSDGDFSFLLTMSSLISMFSFLMVFVKIERIKSVAGVSSRMMECYVILLAARLCSIIPFEGYLPWDRSGDWLYQTAEVLSLFLSTVIVYSCRKRYVHTYDDNGDSINHLYIALPAFLLSLILHPSLNAFMPADIAWTFALYLEALASLPQLFMFTREGKVEPFMSHFLGGQALSKVCSFVFWLSTYQELNDPSKSMKSYVGVWVIVMQSLQLLVMGDFIYHYVRCLSRGVPVQFLLNESV